MRDPDYGNGLDRRMQVSLTSLAEIALNVGLDYELVVTEWNPPRGKARLRESLTFPRPAHGRVRFIEVPAEVHDRLPNADRLPIFEYIGKNVAIRRSRGEWILSCTPDVIFGRDLLRFLARGPLAEDAFYRVDRYDVAAQAPLRASWRRRLRFCESNVSVVQGRDGPHPPSPPPRLKERLLQALRPAPVTQAADGDPAALHTNASGDFFLMSRLNWFRLHGFAEEYTHAHIDSIMCWTAASAGLRQVVLGGAARLYHQEHDRSLQGAFPETNWRHWHERFLEASIRREPLIANDDAWGMRDTELPEYAI